MKALFLTAALLSGPAFAQQEPIELYPTDHGRMYMTSRPRLLEAVDTTLEELDLRVTERDEHGVRLTPSKRIRKQDREATGVKAGAEVAFSLWIPASSDLARLYINAIVLTDGKTFYNYGSVERWLFAEIESRLDIPAMGIPIDPRVRGEAISAMLGEVADQRCLARLDETYSILAPPGYPVLIEATKLTPIFPETGRQRREEAELAVKVVVAEDGTVHQAQVLKSSSLDREFLASALGAVRLWRYLPGRVDDCPVTSYHPIFIDYRLH